MISREIWREIMAFRGVRIILNDIILPEIKKKIIYGVSTVSILEKIDRVVTAPHCNANIYSIQIKHILY